VGCSVGSSCPSYFFVFDNADVYIYFKTCIINILFIKIKTGPRQNPVQRYFYSILLLSNHNFKVACNKIENGQPFRI